LEAAIHAGLDRLAAAPGPVAAGALRSAAKDIATILLLRLLLGVTPESPAYRQLREQLERFGPDGGPIDEVDRAAVRSFAELRSTVLAEIDRRSRSPADEAPSVLGHMQAAGTLDETLLGNLIQILQTGRYDLTGLLAWLLYFLAGAPEVLERIRKGGGGDGGGHSLATAAVLETLRLAQSEYLRRRVTESIVFDGFLIPRGSLVRICIVEGHRDPANFSPIPPHFFRSAFSPRNIRRATPPSVSTITAVPAPIGPSTLVRCLPKSSRGTIVFVLHPLARRSAGIIISSRGRVFPPASSGSPPTN
jgi:cytochrome P450